MYNSHLNSRDRTHLAPAHLVEKNAEYQQKVRGAAKRWLAHHAPEVIELRWVMKVLRLVPCCVMFLCGTETGRALPWGRRTYLLLHIHTRMRTYLLIVNTA
jgi:hypothetical protein